MFDPHGLGCHYKFIDGPHLIPPDLKVIVFGVPRSGTTFLTGLLSTLLGDGVYKTHEYVHPDPMPTTYVIVRDFRDCITSAFESFYPDEQVVSVEFVRHITSEWRSVFESLLKYTTMETTTLVKYENCVFNPENLAESLGMNISSVASAYAKNNFLTNKQIVDGLSEHQPNGMFTVRHMHDGATGKYKKWMSPDTLEEANSILRSHLEHFGYAIGD